MKFKIISLNIGPVTKLTAGHKQVQSGYCKNPVDSAFLTNKGFTGDRQADLKHHGGVDKAICVYSLHNLPVFEQALQRPLPVPAFGENLSVDKADEAALFIGDIFTNGTVVVQISQPRQPCFKTGLFHGDNKVIKVMADSGATGFYFRVLKTGTVYCEDVLERIESHEQYSLQHANDLMYGRNKSLADLKALTTYKALSTSWQDELSRKWHARAR